MKSESPHFKLYEIIDNNSLSLEEKQEKALSLGKRYLDVENGHIKRQDKNSNMDEIIFSVGGEDNSVLPNKGDRIDRCNTYCLNAIESNYTLALSDAPNKGIVTQKEYEGIDFLLSWNAYFCSR